MLYILSLNVCTIIISLSNRDSVPLYSTKTPPGVPTTLANLRHASLFSFTNTETYRTWLGVQPHRWSVCPPPWNCQSKTFLQWPTIATLQETQKQSDWASLVKIAPHLHKVENISTRIAWITLRCYPQCTTQVIDSPGSIENEWKALRCLHCVSVVDTHCNAADALPGWRHTMWKRAPPEHGREASALQVPVFRGWPCV